MEPDISVLAEVDHCLAEAGSVPRDRYGGFRYLSLDGFRETR